MCKLSIPLASPFRGKTRRTEGGHQLYFLFSVQVEKEPNLT